MLDLISKLYTEHESAPILKERLGLIQDKASELERQLNLLTTEVLVLRKENAEQKAENVKLVTENTAFKERIRILEQPKAGMSQMKLTRG